MPKIAAGAGRPLGRAAAAVVALIVLSGLAAAYDRAQAAAHEGYLQGRLLVATPEMDDPRFAETVIYMVRHNAEGALGLVLNRLVGVGPLADLLAGLGIEGDSASGEVRIHYGGPVQMNLGFVLHSTDYVADGTLIVSDDVAFTTSADILHAIGAGEGPRRSLVALGYAGWSAGQLESEIKVKAWVAVPADERLIFDDDLDGKWERALAKHKIDL